jgi:hypothetical protein
MFSVSVVFILVSLFCDYSFSQNSCNAGYTYDSNIHLCWKYFTAAATYDAAAGICTSEGAVLMTASTSAKNLLMGSVVSANGGTGYWNGLRKISGLWKW